MTDLNINAILEKRNVPTCANIYECPHKRGKYCFLSIDIPNGSHNDCKAQRFPNAKEEVQFT
jgi:hypothetical protein